jgi:hypothetical protein
MHSGSCAGFGEGDGLGALGRHPADLSRGPLDVPERDEHHGDLTVGGRRTPFVDQPVVVGGDARGGQILVLGGVERVAREAREGREAQLSVDAVRVHVLEPGVDVVTAGQHVAVADGIGAVILAILAGDRAQAPVEVGPTLEDPHVTALVVALGTRPGFAELGREMVLPHIRRLDHVVVDGDNLYIIREHDGNSTTSPPARPTLTSNFGPRERPGRFRKGPSGSAAPAGR